MEARTLRQLAPLSALGASLAALLVYAQRGPAAHEVAARFEPALVPIERAAAEIGERRSQECSSLEAAIERSTSVAPPGGTAALRVESNDGDDEITLVVHVRGTAEEEAPAGVVAQLWRGGLPADAARAAENELALGADGSIEFARLAREPYGLRVAAAGRASFELELDLAHGRRAQRHVAAHLPPLGAPLVGRVLDARGSPVAGALVCLDSTRAQASATRFERATTRGDARPLPLPPRARTDAAGRFVLAVPAGEMPLELVVCPDARDEVPLHRTAWDGAARSELVVALPETVRLELRFDAGELTGGARGIVLRRGALVLDPALDPLVARLAGAEALRGIEREAGALRLRLPPGRYELELERTGSPPERRVIEVRDGPNLFDLRLAD